MAIRVVGFKWYDGFFLSMLAFSIFMVLFSWKHYHACKIALHLWIVVDYTAVFIFRILMFIDNGIASGMGLDYGRQQRDTCFCGRIMVLSILYGLIYPFLWGWTIVGCLWFATSKKCLPEKNQQWGFLIWLLFSFCGLICLAGEFVRNWIKRRRAHLRRAQQGIPISEFGVFVDLIRRPDWVFETAEEMRAMGEDNASYHPGLYLSQSQREVVDTLIQELPMFVLKAVPADCGDCPICLEEFHVGDEVRGLPCAHNFHADCIDKWLRLNVKCPRCRCSVFPNADLNGQSTIPVNPDRSSTLSTINDMRSQPSSQSFILRMQGFLLPVRSANAESSSSSSSSFPNTSSSSIPGYCSSCSASSSSTPSSSSGSAIALEIVENGGQQSESHGPHAGADHVQ